MRRDRSGVGFFALATSGTIALASGGAAAQSTGSADPGQRSTEFQAVEGGTEMVSGGTLLVEAYGALWVILLGFLLVSWRRQARIDARVAELERAVARGGAK